MSACTSGWVAQVHILRIEVQVSSVDLIESPQQVLRRSVHVVPTRVVREVIAEGRPSQLLLEEIDLVEEENDTRSHEPPRIHD